MTGDMRWRCTKISHWRITLLHTLKTVHWLHAVLEEVLRFFIMRWILDLHPSGDANKTPKTALKYITWVHVLSYFQPLTACINLPVSALSLCTDSRPSGSGSLSLTAPHSAPTLTENIKTIILTDKFTDFCNEHKGSWDTSDRFTLHRLCRPPVLLLGYLELLSLERRNISLATNHSHSNILVPWANRRIMTGPRKHAKFVDKMPLLTRPLSRCPRAKHITVKQK